MLPFRHHLLLAAAGLPLLAILAASSCGGDVQVANPPPNDECSGSGGTGSSTSTGGPVACTDVAGLCQTWCAGAGAKDGDHCLAKCLGFYEGSYPDCADAYTAHLACQVAHMDDPDGCACKATDAARGACIEAHPSCDGVECKLCTCSTTCSTVFTSACADGMCTCSIGGKVVGTCAENCNSADMATCCAAIFFQTCP